MPKKRCFKNERRGRGETSSPLLAFQRGHSLWEAEPGPGLLPLTERGQWPPAFFATTWHFPCKTAEVLIIRIGQEQELFIEACCFPAGAGSGSPVEPFISALTMTVCCRAFRAQQRFPHSSERPELAPVIVRIWQRQKERESLANTYFSFCTVFLSLSS